METLTELSKFRSILSIFVKDQVNNAILKIITIILTDIRVNAYKFLSDYLKYKKYSIGKSYSNSCF